MALGLLTPDEKVALARRLIFAADVERRSEKKAAHDALLCQCGHRRDDHTESYSINFTGGFCRTCDCKHFMTPRALQNAQVEGRQVAISVRMQKKVDQDAQMVLPLLGHTFVARDVGLAMHTVGRHWSEHAGTINRLERHGYVKLIGRTGDARGTRIWEKVALGSIDTMEAHHG